MQGIRQVVLVQLLYEVARRSRSTRLVPRFHSHFSDPLQHSSGGERRRDPREFVADVVV